MKIIIKKIYSYIFIFRTIFPIISLFIDSELKKVVLEDLERLNNEIKLKNKIIFLIIRC